ncbi:MAG: hypothetical protein MMC23_000980 [Stictis urceolatum]|nr:hypothetical protein [Stictis urceolata]
MTSDPATNISQINVIKLRVVAHTMGPVIPGGQVSQNHWSFYLLIPDGGSVRINMEWKPDSPDDRGKLGIIKHTYAQTTSAVRTFDYDVHRNARVASFLQIIGNKRRQNYKMTPTGVGCRFWVITVLEDWFQAGLVTTPDAVQSLAGDIRFNYSKYLEPIPLPIQQGQWY